MNLITSTHEDLVNAGTKNEIAKVRKQLRFITDLYANFPCAVVAGGAPFNHFHQVGAKDIDIFVRSQDEALRIINHYNGNCRLIFDRSGPVTTQHYTEMHNTHVYEGIVTLKGNSFLVNVIVRPNTSEERILRVTELFESFPYLACCHAYTVAAGQLVVVQGQGQRPFSKPRYEPAPEEYTEKLIRKLLLLSHAPKRWFITPNISSVSTMPKVSVGYHHSVIRKVNKDMGIALRPNWELNPRTRAGQALLEYCKDFKSYNELLAHTQTTRFSALYPNGEAKPLSVLYKEVLDSFASGTGSRPQDGTDTGDTVQELQSSGRTDTEVGTTGRPSVWIEWDTSPSVSSGVADQAPAPVAVPRSFLQSFGF